MTLGVQWLIATVLTIEVLDGILVSRQVVEVLISENPLLRELLESPELARRHFDLIKRGRLIDLKSGTVAALLDEVEVDVIQEITILLKFLNRAASLLRHLSQCLLD